MARRKRRTRTVGSVIVNPRRRRRTTARRKRRSNPRRRRTTARRRKRRMVKRRRSTARRRNPRRKRRTTRRRRTSARRRRNPRRRRRSARRTRRRAAAVSNPRRRRKRRTKRRRSRARRNPAFVSGLARSLKKVPVIGGLLAGMAAIGFHGFIGGISVEPTMRVAGWLATQTWVPEKLKASEWFFFGVTGTALGALVVWLGPKTKALTPEAAKRVGIAVSAAGWGAGYALMRERQMANEAGIATPAQQVAGSTTEGLGMLTMQSSPLGALGIGYGSGPAYSVGPQGSFGPGGYGGMGAVVIGA